MIPVRACSCSFCTKHGGTGFEFGQGRILRPTISVGRYDLVPEYRGRKRARLDDDGVDAQWGEFVTVTFGERLECTLGRCIRHTEWKGCAGGDARHVHQQARCPLSHVG